MLRGRPRKLRIVRNDPRIKQFSPRGRRGRPADIELKMEEHEAIRLSDHLGLSQKEAAQFMGISQQTFSRVLRAARKTIAKALVKGDIIRIKGGNFRLHG